MSVIEVTGNNIEIICNPKNYPKILYFTAKWCGPCQTIAPTYATLASKNAGRAYFYKIDVDENSDIALKFGIKSMPTFYFYNTEFEYEKAIGSDTRLLHSNIVKLVDKEGVNLTGIIETNDVRKK